MEYIVYSDEHFRQKKVSKKLFESLARYCTTDDTKFKSDFDDCIFKWCNITGTYVKQQFESNDFITHYYWIADGRPMGYIRKNYY